MRHFTFVIALSLLGWAPMAQAEWFGNLQLASDRIERGLSQSERNPSASALLGFRHRSSLGLASVSLGAATVSDEQFVGSSGYKLMPELAWSSRWGTDDAGHLGLALRGQLFPGARGPWFGNLPAAAQGRLQRAQVSDYSTAEIGASLGWHWVTLSLTRSLTDYQGLSSTETGPLGTRVIESSGTTYVSLDIEWPLAEGWTVCAGAGQLRVPNFESLGYTDWRLGVSARAWGLLWGLQASGSNAIDTGWQVRNQSGSARGSRSNGQAVVATLAWLF